MLQHKPQDIHVLVVDDSVTNQEVVMAMLSCLGYPVDVVDCGTKALKAMEEKWYDVVLMDCQMPEMDGFEATRQIRASSVVKNPKARIIAMTASDVSGSRERCFEAGMNDFFQKPIAAYPILRSIEEHMDVSLNGKTNGPQKAQDLIVFDKTGFVGRVGDLEMARTIALHFIHEFPKRLAAIQEAVEKRDAHSLQRLAHSIKGTAANLGALALNDTAAAMEKASKEGFERGAEFVPHLIWEYERFRETVEGVWRQPSV